MHVIFYLQRRVIFTQEVENNAELKQKLAKLEKRLKDKEDASADEKVFLI